MKSLQNTRKHTMTLAEQIEMAENNILAASEAYGMISDTEADAQYAAAKQHLADLKSEQAKAG